MNDDQNGGVPPDGTPRPDNAADKLHGWQMPEPKFQQSSGYLPQGYLEQAGLAAKAAPAAAPSPVTAPDMEVPLSAIGAEPTPEPVGPQPDLEISEAPVAPAPAPARPADQRSTGARAAMVLLGVAGMIAFIAIFLAVVYYLFLRPADGSGPF